MLEKSLHSQNPYALRTSLDGTKVIIKCNCCNISVDLFKLGILPKNRPEFLTYVNDPNNGFTELVWNSLELNDNEQLTLRIKL